MCLDGAAPASLTLRSIRASAVSQEVLAPSGVAQGLFLNLVDTAG